MMLHGLVDHYFFCIDINGSIAIATVAKIVLSKTVLPCLYKLSLITKSANLYLQSMVARLRSH